MSPSRKQRDKGQNHSQNTLARERGTISTFSSGTIYFEGIDLNESYRMAVYVQYSIGQHDCYDSWRPSILWHSASALLASGANRLSVARCRPTRAEDLPRPPQSSRIRYV